jgi:hypothetical protein
MVAIMVAFAKRVMILDQNEGTKGDTLLNLIVTS